MTLGGGVGYRKKGIFIDLTYVEAILNDVNFPYRLADKDNVLFNCETVYRKSDTDFRH